MWTRSELKERGKAAIKANRWRCVLVAILTSIAAGGSGGGSVSGAGNVGANPSINEQAISDMIRNMDPRIWAAIGIVGLTSVLIGIGISAFLLGPLEVGCRSFFTENLDKASNLDRLGDGFKKNYWNAVKTMFIKGLYQFLWSLLFVIPGIVKGYSYRMVPYILADNPDMDTDEIITLSREMMDGNKWKAFVLDFSFIGWHILGALTFGVVEILHAAPYHQSTSAALYAELAGRRPEPIPGEFIWN